MQCRIFRNPERNKMIDSDSEKISFLEYYYPKYDRSYEDMNEFSHMILDVKKDEINLDENSGEYRYYEKAINYFTDRLRPFLSNTEDYVICVYPKHTVGITTSGMRRVGRQLCSPPIIDGMDILSRGFTIPKKAKGGDRDLQKEIESLTVRNKSVVKDRQVLLLDDVTTTGTSLNAGKYVLKQTGAALVALLSLGKTQ